MEAQAETEDTIAQVLELARREQTLHPSRTLCRAIIKHILSGTTTSLSLVAYLANAINASEPPSTLAFSRFLIGNSIVNYALAFKVFDDISRVRVPYLKWRQTQRTKTDSCLNNNKQIMIDILALCASSLSSDILVIESGKAYPFNFLTISLASYYSANKIFNHHYPRLADWTQPSGPLKFQFCNGLRATANYFSSLDEIPAELAQVLKPSNDQQQKLIKALDNYFQQHPQASFHPTKNHLDTIVKTVLTAGATGVAALSYSGMFSTIINAFHTRNFPAPIAYVAATLFSPIMINLFAESNIRAANYYLWDAPISIIRNQSIRNMPLPITTRLYPTAKLTSKALLYFAVGGVSWQYCATNILNPSATPIINDNARTALFVMALISSTTFMGEIGEGFIDYFLGLFAKRQGSEKSREKYLLCTALNNAANNIELNMRADEFDVAFKKSHRQFPVFFKHSAALQPNEQTKLLVHETAIDIEMAIESLNGSSAGRDEFSDTSNLLSMAKNNIDHDCGEYTAYQLRRMNDINTWCW